MSAHSAPSPGFPPSRGSAATRYDAYAAGMGAAGARSTPALPPPSSPVHELRTLVQSHHSAIALDTDDEARALAIIDAVSWDLRIPVFDWTLTSGLQRRGADQPIYETSKPYMALASIAEMGTEAVFVMRDLRPQLADRAVVRGLLDVLDRFEASPRRSTVVMLGTAPDLPAGLRDRVVHLPAGLPTAHEYREVVQAVAQSLSLARSAEIALAPADYDILASALRGLTLNQARQAVARAAVEDGRLDLNDVPRLHDLKARTLGAEGLLEYFPPDDNPATLGGFERLHAWLGRARVGFSEQARALNLPAPKGVLLTGVQGCGKSLAAKAIARAWGLPLVKLDAGRLYDKYIGESERNLRRSLEIATSLAPAVLWIDEIEKALATGSADGADGGVSQRLLGTLLTWMSERDESVFLVATANDVFRLPPELLRKGRFDELFFVDLPTAVERTEILRIHLQMRRQDPAAIDLARLVAATDGFSGAELEQVVVGALLGALHAGTALTVDALLTEARDTVPLSQTRREDVARLRQQAAGRFVPVSAPAAAI